MQSHAYLFVLVAAAIAAVAIIFSPASFNQSGCTLDAKICPDGSSVERVPPYCGFQKCPQLVECSFSNTCLNGKCVFYPGEDKSHCYKGSDPCLLCSSGICELEGNYPPKVICKSESGLNEQQCLERKGRWATTGKTPTCYLKTKDANLPCTGSEECESLCVTQNQFYTTGKCHFEEPFSGCAFILENGVNEGRICA